MDEISLTFDGDLQFPFTLVEGTGKSPFIFGTSRENRVLQEITTPDFFISRFLVTQGLWARLTAERPIQYKGENFPVYQVSYNEITGGGGFLDTLNSHASASLLRKDLARTTLTFRLPSETEWEYAARGGVHWRDDLIFSGSNDLDEVGWYEANSGRTSHVVGQKKSNQLGLYDMNGNLWEWCADYFQRDTNKIPKDGSPCGETSDARVLRGGCHHNGPMHCTTTWRYEIRPDFKDDCIGFRLAFSV